jgi:uncharacterized LabA/DUF88 family protein
MDRLVVLVDAGYLFSQAIQLLSNKKSRSRSELRLKDAPGLIAMLVNKAKNELQNQNLLRVYWYDGVKGALSDDHRAIVGVDDVQLRAGTINGSGQQKGVDSRIVIDLIELATNQAISDAMIVTGDGDLAIGIELSQRRGIRVAALGVEDNSKGVHHAQSPDVTDVADRVIRISTNDLSDFLEYAPKEVAKPPQLTECVTLHYTNNATDNPESLADESQQETDIAAIVRQFIASTTLDLAPSKAITPQGGIEPGTDKKLLFFALQAIGRKLSDAEKRQARTELRTSLECGHHASD